jgi:hypothetical protein
MLGSLDQMVARMDIGIPVNCPHARRSSDERAAP